jgi:hypothetical protein
LILVRADLPLCLARHLALSSTHEPGNETVTYPLPRE